MSTVRELWSSWATRSLVVAIGIKVLLWLSGPTVRNFTLVGLVDAATSLVVIGALGYLLVPLAFDLQRRLLWRVRRKLILSYIFIGLIPVLLIGVFFLLAGALTLLSASGYLVELSLDDLVDEARVAANGVVAELETSQSATRLDLDRHRRALADRHPDASLSLVATDAGGGFIGTSSGPWRHVAAPQESPGWNQSDRFAGLIVVDVDERPRLVARALLSVSLDGVPAAVIVDLPVGEVATLRLLEQTGVELREVALDFDANGSPPVDSVAESAGNASPTGASGDALTPLTASGGLTWFSFLGYTDWASGEPGFLYQEIRVAPGALYNRIFGAQARIGDFSLGYAFLVALAIVGSLFLVIEFTALVMGLALARSITGSVHELFIGTEQVRGGDFGHRIVVHTADQLGELAESFNAMTGSMKDLLRQAAEKKRLEEELRIAREIQMSLLPRDTVTMPGVTVSATCVPAREVGGDYYDCIRLGERRLGILVADVSGKGASAAFYMAELKGLILSLSRIYESPKQLLIEVNRLIADHIDSRSFITMTYAVLDLDTETLTYARAGHTPLIYMRGNGNGSGADVLIPSGLVVGLDGFQPKFEILIEEASLHVRGGDIAVLFTDGVSEAMNEEDDLFGEERLGRLVEDNVHLGAEALRDRILADVDAFVGSADQHDDMTLVLLKIDADFTGVSAVASGMG